MLDDFLTYIREQSLFQKDERILLAVSGGIDSVVLTHLFHKAKYQFDIAHCNFSLREEAGHDQTFVKDMASEYGASFRTINFDTNQYASEKKVSIQMAARELRYEWFASLIEEHSYKYICTAHHHSDSIETVLFNISKGTGVSGIRGIQSKNGNIIRPLLFATKNEIEKYAKENHIEWREDTSNASDKYHRNYIRHHVLPNFEHINPSFEKTTKTTLDRLKDAEDIVLSAVDSAKRLYYRLQGVNHYFELDKINQLGGCTTILHQLTKPFGFNYVQSQDIIKRSAETGKTFLSGSHQANIDRKQLIISPLQYENNSAPILIVEGVKTLSVDDIILDIEECEIPESIGNDQDIGLFDLTKLSFPLTVRTWQQGDKFYPLGMTQQKKLSDFLIDSKVPLNFKDNIKVITSKDQIIWVIGHRIDNRFKIDQHTANVLKIGMRLIK